MKKGIGPVVASALLLVTAVIAIVSFQTWYGSYSTDLFSKVESENSNEALNTIIETIVGDELYFTNSFNENLSLNSVKINGATCNDVTTSNITSGINSINFGNCTQNLTGGSYEVVVSTDQGVFSKKIYLKAGTTSTTSLSEEESETIAENLFVNSSLRFNDDDSAYLTRTPSGTGNQTTWTWSGWVKRSAPSSTRQDLFSAGDTSANEDLNIYFNNNGGGGESQDIFKVNWVSGGTGIAELSTSGLFRDPSSWIHFLVSVDTRQATSSDRVNIYINGDLIENFAEEIYPSQNYEGYVNSLNAHNIGAARAFTASNYFDGYMANIHFVDGQALTPDYFGKNDSYNKWIPKVYNGTYGTNGFHLPFSNSSSIGQDFSGNGNNWTTSGVTSDDLVNDTPTNNYATLNIVNSWNTGGGGISGSLAEGNLEYSGSSTGNDMTLGSIAVSEGKWYWEVSHDTSGSLDVGTLNILAGTSSDYSNTIGDLSFGYSYRHTGNVENGGSESAYGATYTNGDIIGVFLNLDDGELTYYKNGVSQGVAFNISGEHIPAIGQGSTSNEPDWTANFGQLSDLSGSSTTYNSSVGGSFVYTPPLGSKAISTRNVDDSYAINDPYNYFSPVLYTGTGSAQSIDSLSFSPDFTWIKNRDQADSYNILDSIRGATFEWNSDSTGAESTDSNGLTSFDSNGFTLGTGASGYNDNTEDFVSWNWLESSTSGFDIVRYIGTGSDGLAIEHSLENPPEFIIVKNLNNTGGATHGEIYHQGLGSSSGIQLSSTNAVSSTTQYWSADTPNSTHFILGTDRDVNYNGDTFIAYLFSETEGFSKFGSYTGNGNANGPFIYTGFEPALIIIKRTDLANSWIIKDNKRDILNPSSIYLQLESSSAETTSTNEIDMLSNGFKLRDDIAGSNSNSAEYIYIAFAEKPFR